MALYLVGKGDFPVLPFVCHVWACGLAFQPGILPHHHTVNIRKHERVLFVIVHKVRAAHLFPGGFREPPCHVFLKFPALAHCLVINVLHTFRGLVKVHLHGRPIGVQPADCPGIRAAQPQLPVPEPFLMRHSLCRCQFLHSFILPFYLFFFIILPFHPALLGCLSICPLICRPWRIIDYVPPCLPVHPAFPCCPCHAIHNHLRRAYHLVRLINQGVALHCL